MKNANLVNHVKNTSKRKQKERPYYQGYIHELSPGHVAHIHPDEINHGIKQYLDLDDLNQNEHSSNKRHNSRSIDYKNRYEYVDENPLDYKKMYIVNNKRSHSKDRWNYKSGLDCDRSSSSERYRRTVKKNKPFI